MNVSVVVPALNAESTLAQSLGAIRASKGYGESLELIVFDDGSTDSTATIAQDFGALVLQNSDLPIGPAAGRNRAAEHASGDVLVFVDADVIVRADAVQEILKPLQENDDIAATFGSYDTACPGRHLAGQYVNLRHHFIHQSSAGEASTFWSGFGAIRRDVFLAIDGFDESFSQPSIEDIDLGTRVVREGHRIWLTGQAQVTHAKDWTLSQVWRTDIVLRALPWAALIAQGRGKPTLNASQNETLKAAIAHTVWASALCGVIVPQSLWVSLVAIVAYLALNRSFMAVLHRRGGFRLTGVGTILHWCYHNYSSAILGVALLAQSITPSTWFRTEPAPTYSATWKGLGIEETRS